MQSLSHLPDPCNQVGLGESGQVPAGANTPRLKYLLMLRHEVQHAQWKIPYRIRLFAGWHYTDAGSAECQTHGSIKVLRDGYVCEETGRHDALPQSAGELCGVPKQSVHAVYVEDVSAGM